MSEQVPVATVVKIFRPNIVVERGDPMLGGREVWQRYPDHPECDTLLVTVHYSYGALDNASIGPVAEMIADLFRPKNTGGSDNG